MIQIIKRKRKFSPNPNEYLRLHRAEYGHNFKTKIDINSYYPDIHSLIKQVKKFFKIKNKNSLVLGAGAESLIKDAFIYHSSFSKIRHCLIYNPNYYMYEYYSKVFKYKLYKINLSPADNENTILEKLINKIKEKKINLLCLVNPSAPLEKEISKKKIIELCNFCKKNKILIILDEVYLSILDFQNIMLTKKFNNLLIIKSFSKMAGFPGIRLGVGICGGEIFKALDSLRLSIEITSDTTEQIKKLLVDKQKLIKIENSITKSREYVHKILKKNGLNVYNNKINSVFVNLNSQHIKQKVIKKLNSKNILVNGNFDKNLKNYINFSTTKLKNVKIITTEIIKSLHESKKYIRK